VPRDVNRHDLVATVSRVWRILSASFWFLPTLLTVTALVIAPILVQLDERLQAAGRSVAWLEWIYGGGLQGARRLLSAIAAAMMAISTVMFSSQTTALTFIGQEYGSRLLRNFLADTRNQLAFGIYISTFIYALMVLRTIHKDPDDAPVPHLAVSFGIILAMAGLGVLIYSMYHISRFLQASTIIGYAARDLDAAIVRLTPEKPPRRSGGTFAGDDDAQGASAFDFIGVPIIAASAGYLQRVKTARLARFCRNAGCRIRIDRKIGDFAMAGASLGAVAPLPPPNSDLFMHIQQTIVLGPQPNIDEDLRYAANQLVQIALRAASTDRNDSLTAIMCIDRMGAALCLMGRRMPADAIIRDMDGAPRLKLESANFADMLDVCCRPLREYREASPSVLVHMLTTLRAVADCTQRPEDRRALRREAMLFAEAGCDQRGGDPAGRKRIARAYEDVCRALDAFPSD
jgi:uncharacterized membrane protein